MCHPPSESCDHGKYLEMKMSGLERVDRMKRHNNTVVVGTFAFLHFQMFFRWQCNWDFDYVGLNQAAWVIARALLVMVIVLNSIKIHIPALRPAPASHVNQ